MEQASTQKLTLQDYAPKHYIELSELEENFDYWMEVVEKDVIAIIKDGEPKFCMVPEFIYAQMTAYTSLDDCSGTLIPQSSISGTIS